jgi:glycosyltransferase involved in cell wall biosynthesis
LLANAINSLCLNPELVKKMGKHAYEKAKRTYSPDNVKQIEKIYKNQWS